MISEGPLPLYLRTKLLPPRPALAFLPRPRLVERLAANVAQPLTLVTANAGSGKTTLVADFVRRHAPRHVWYQLDRTDGDPAVFLGYLATGIRSVFETLGDATLDYVRGSASEVANQPERAADVLLNEILDAVDERLVIVLDDYHHLGADAPVHRVVERLLAYLPETVHTIIVSREMPPLAVSRVRTHDKVVVVGRQDLLFTDDEVADLFGSVFGIEMSARQLATFRERTQGWITALQLVRQVARRTHAAETPVDLLPALEQSERDIFEYFAEEVFADEQPKVRELLLRSSLLERADVVTCAALFGDLEPVATFSSLVRRHVFVSMAGDGDAAEFRLHPLFRGFLRRRCLSTYGPEGVAAEHERIARHFVAVGRDDDAARHLVAAGRDDDAAEVVARRAEEWIAAGLFNQLVSICAAIPEAALERAPRALLHRAEVARLQGDLDAAEPLLNRAARALAAAGDAEGEAEALHGLAALARRIGDIPVAFDRLDRAAAIAPPDARVHVRCANTRGLCLIARSEWAAAEREFHTGLERARLRGE
jgi:LuxR family maltose regulon positive regulatory protein